MVLESKTSSIGGRDIILLYSIFQLAAQLLQSSALIWWLPQPASSWVARMPQIQMKDLCQPRE